MIGLKKAIDLLRFKEKLKYTPTKTVTVTVTVSASAAVNRRLLAEHSFVPLSAAVADADTVSVRFLVKDFF